MTPETGHFGITKALNKGLELYKAGHLHEAQKVCQEILRNAPDHSETLYYLGLVHHQLNENVKAINFICKAINFSPENPWYFNDLGLVFKSSGQLEKAIRCFEKAVSLHPSFAEAYANMGNVFLDKEKLEDAQCCYRKSLEIEPDQKGLYNHLGNICSARGQLDEAIRCYQKILKIDPEHAEAYNNIGVMLKQKGKYGEAIPFFQNAIHLKPDYPLAYNNLGTVFHEMNQLAEAVSSFKTALHLDGTYVNAHYNLANAFQHQGRITEAISEYKRVLEIKPDHLPAYQNFLFTLQYDETAKNTEIFLETKTWWDQLRNALTGSFEHAYNHEAPHRLRIGYVSPDFRQHSVSYFFLPLIAAHDRSKFEIFCYAEVKKPDEITKQIKKMCDGWRSTSGLSDKAVAKCIHDDHIDILVDLAGHTRKNRLPVFALKPAPIQVSWLGFPGTTGMTVMDYRLTDNIADPIGEADKYHTETLIRLPNGFLCYSPPNDAPDVSDLPTLATGNITFGSFNNLAKISKRTISAWSQILRHTPGSNLILKSKALADESTKSYYLKLFLENKIPSDRIRMFSFIPFIHDHLTLYNQIDIALDPFPYNGTTTTCEALWMGVPVITLTGNRHASRVGTSLLNLIGLSELIAENIEVYVAKACQLASDLTHLSKLRNELRKRMKDSALCNAKSFACEVEYAYVEMWNGL